MDKTKYEDRCYICDHIFTNDIHENMFEKRQNGDQGDVEQNSLAEILAKVLDEEVEEEQVHANNLCSCCKVNLLSYETLQLRLRQLRSYIVQKHRRTSTLYKDKNPESLPLILNEECEIDQLSDIIELIPESEEFSVQTLIEEQPEDSSVDDINRKSEYACSYCDYVCYRPTHLAEHERTHTGDRPFVCRMCDKSFAQRSNWRSHMRTTHAKLTPFKCTQCERRFKRRRLLDNHIRSVHQMRRDFQCTECDADFVTHVNLMKHMSCHTGELDYACLICGKEFSRAENRDIHMYVHSIRKPFTCQVCGMGFLRRQQIVNHINAQNHPNSSIVRSRPVFNAANSAKLANAKEAMLK